MELRDLIVTPLVIMLVYAAAFAIRPYVSDSVNRKYFFPALSLKIFGAIALGFLYQFYYGGGDTFNYHTHGSRPIWEAFWESPLIGLKLLFSRGELTGETFETATKVTFYLDPSSFFVVRVSTVFDLITFSSYSATATLFAVLGFSGMWAFFLTFYKQAPQQHKLIAFSALFIPSVIFWGSGIMKDTVTLASLGFLTYAIHKVFIERRFSIGPMILIAINIVVIYSVKKYILLCFFPATLLWIYASNLRRIQSPMLRLLVIPLVLAALVLSSYYSVILVGSDDPKYAIDKLAGTAQITAYDIGFYTGKDAGSGYDLGELDGTFVGMLKLLPQAINVALFRPYLWEVRNPLMILSALESLGLFCLTLFIISRFRREFFLAFLDPPILFCIVFSLTFAFAVGVSTFNFGTLARYKIPLMPFYTLALALILNYVKRERKVEVLEVTE